jgi:DNA-binding protein Fis
MIKDIIYKIDEDLPLASSEKIYEGVIKYVEKILLERALERSYGNQIMAAKMLGLNRNTLHKKIKELRIDIQKFKR